MNCPFCNTHSPITENELVAAIYDQYPVSPGHILLITKRHIADYFDTTADERWALDRLLEECKHILRLKYNPDGFNSGINCGETAGQTIFHVHVHLIPRYAGDMNDPRGGVRGVIPDRRLY